MTEQKDTQDQFINIATIIYTSINNIQMPNDFLPAIELEIKNHLFQCDIYELKIR